MSPTKPVLAPLQTKRPASPLDAADDSVTPVKREECRPLWSSSLDRFSDLALPSPSEILRRDTKDLEDTPLVTEKYKAFLDAWGGKYDKLASPSSGSSPTSRPASAFNGSFNFSGSAESPSEAATESLQPATPISATPRSATSSKRYRYSLHFPPSPVTSSHQGAISRSATPRSATYPRFRHHESMTPLSATTPRSATGPFSTRVTYQTVTQTVTFKRTHLEAPPRKRRKQQETPAEKTE